MALVQPQTTCLVGMQVLASPSAARVRPAGLAAQGPQMAWAALPPTVLTRWSLAGLVEMLPAAISLEAAAVLPWLWVDLAVLVSMRQPPLARMVRVAGTVLR
jgi:hypothetical protein